MSASAQNRISGTLFLLIDGLIIPAQLYGCPGTSLRRLGKCHKEFGYKVTKGVVGGKNLHPGHRPSRSFMIWLYFVYMYKSIAHCMRICVCARARGQHPKTKARPPPKKTRTRGRKPCDTPLPMQICAKNEIDAVCLRRTQGKCGRKKKMLNQGLSKPLPPPYKLWRCISICVYLPHSIAIPSNPLPNPPRNMAHAQNERASPLSGLRRPHADNPRIVFFYRVAKEARSDREENEIERERECVCRPPGAGPRNQGFTCPSRHQSFCTPSAWLLRGLRPSRGAACSAGRRVS